MNKRLLTLAAIGAFSAPAMGGLSIDLVRGEQAPKLVWTPTRTRHRLPKRARRDASRLQLRGWPGAPCEAPEGYFWHRSSGGRQLYYLLKKAPGERSVTYDAAFDRSIIRSGWGYANPTYAHGDVR